MDTQHRDGTEYRAFGAVASQESRDLDCDPVNSHLQRKPRAEASIREFYFIFKAPQFRQTREEVPRPILELICQLSELQSLDLDTNTEHLASFLEILANTSSINCPTLRRMRLPDWPWIEILQFFTTVSEIALHPGELAGYWTLPPPPPAQYQRLVDLAPRLKSLELFMFPTQTLLEGKTDSI